MNFQAVSDLFNPGDVSEEAIRSALALMENNPALDTKASLAKRDGAVLQLVPFQEKHLDYLMGHPKVNPLVYLANLRTMVKIRE